jgi:Zeta toxin/Cytidylyltransferase-like
MRFKDFLRENTEKHAVLAFGRMNPPTTGHAKLVDKVKSIASEVGGSHHVVLSHTQDKDKNPLSADQKLKHAKRFFPNTNLSVADKDHPTFLQQAAKLYKQGVTHLHMVAGSDRVDEFHKLLHKYNGTHKGALFNFKKITVHSAGERDPDAEGAEGMSASKMRGHAKSGNYKEFKKGVPGHVSEKHAKELYNDVRAVKESVDLNEEFTEYLAEGVHDKAIFKAVFLAGGPGSGKDYVLDNTLAGHGLTEINSDKAFEYLMDKNSLDKKMPDSEEKPRDVVRGRSKNITELKEKLALDGRNGLIINGTGDDPEKILRIKKKLEQLGYDTSMLMVNTKDEVSQQRNIERGQRGGRTVNEKIRKEKWDSVQNARPELAKIFGKTYMEVDNSVDLREAPLDIRVAKKKEFVEIHKTVQNFIAQEPKSHAAQDWIASELHKKDKLPIPKNGAEKVAPQGSKSADEARKLGLQYYGFGRYGKNGHVTHRVVNDNLVDIQQQPKKKAVNEEFEEFFFEDERKTKLLRDKNGKVSLFHMRRAAAEKAHTSDGMVMKHPKLDGYVVKIKEDTENDESIMEFSDNEIVSKERSTHSRDSGTDRDFRIFAETDYSHEKARKKITLTETQTESIDAGIEPGLSMAASGENLSRSPDPSMAVSGIKLSKRKMVKELTGDETGASNGAQKEDELKRKGINLSSFKAKRII